MGKWMDIKGHVIASTVYADKVHVASDVAWELGGLEWMTGEVQAMGTMEVPLIGLLNNIQLTITKIGLDNGFARMNRLEKQNLEMRWVQNVVKADGSMGTEGCKAFIRTLPGTTPGLGLEVGSAPEMENVFNVTRAEVYMDGKEVLVVDRLASILRIDGKDYMSKINSLL